MPSKNKFPPVLATRQGLDSGDDSAPESMDRRDATAECERRLAWRHPVASILGRKRATLARRYAGCPRDLVRLVARHVRVHIFSVLTLLLCGDAASCADG